MHWGEIQTYTTQSPFSISKPVDGPAGKRAVLPQLNHAELLEHKGRSWKGYKYVCETDISEFYHSLYTHSISWALHTKAIAKAQRRNRMLLGNRLDTALRKSQHDQTIGIPVGPDTSLVIAEIVTTACDQILQQRIGNLEFTGYRHYDDYKFAFRQASHAEVMLAQLQDILNDYELRLNPQKTAILEAPVRLEERWISTLKHFEFRTGARKELRDLFRYFDFVGDYVREFPSVHIMKYAIGRLRRNLVAPENWELFQSLLSQALIADPSAVLEYAAVLTRHNEEGYALSRDIIEPVLNRIITTSAVYHYHHEVCW
jgi:hypothetical protein